MRFTAPSLGAVAAVSLVFAACADAPNPAEPAGDIDAAAAQAQDRLPAWFAQSSPVVLALPGTVFADHDEANNRLLFGVEREAAIPGVRRALEALGIPNSVVAIEVTEPIYQLATLRDRFRPTQGGVQIHFGQYLCTLGFNAYDGTERSFITNSHCTGRQGGVESTQYFQPTSSVDPTVIATEVEDPKYSKGGGCPRGRQCRYSDASRARYSGDVASSLGVIAKTTGANNGSLEVAGAFTITSQDASTTSFPTGTVVNKVGRTTGWTQGGTGGTCVNVNVSGSSITQLCQTLVTSSAVIVGGGDSGSGVFRITSGDSVQLVGILWGGSSDGKTFVFSPLKNIIQELGSLSTY